MRLRLDPKWTERLLELPESGMGYHRVNVRLRDGRTLGPLTVLNSQFIDLPEDLANFLPTEIVAIDPTDPSKR
jgi:hypothetical protein